MYTGEVEYFHKLENDVIFADRKAHNRGIRYILGQNILGGLV
jgi:hypothetical protein